MFVYGRVKSQTRIVVIGICLVLTAGCSSIARMGSVSAEEAFQSTLDVTGPLDLEVYTGSGAVQIYGTSGDQVEITGRLQVRSRPTARAEERVREIESVPPIDQTGNRIVIGRSADNDLFENISIAYEIGVPIETTVRAQTGSGRLDIRNLIGDVEARTGSGRVILRDIVGAVRTLTGSGGIEADAIAGSFNGRTGSGTLRLTQTDTGTVDVNTGSGGITLTGISGLLNARTGSGRIQIEGNPAESWTLSTGLGGVTIVLPATADFDLNADAGSGRVNVEAPFEFDGTTDRDRRQMRGSVGAGGPEVGVRTGSGSIRIGTGD